MVRSIFKMSFRQTDEPQSHCQTPLQPLLVTASTGVDSLYM